MNVRSSVYNGIWCVWRKMEEIGKKKKLAEMAQLKLRIFPLETFADLRVLLLLLLFYTK